MARATTDIAVIGGGIMGMSIAYQVARRSKRRVVVLDKGAGLGEGSTGGSAAITRQRYSQPELIRLSRDGNAVFKQWAEYLGLGAPRAEYHESGVLWIFDQPRAEVERDRDRLRAQRVDVVALGPDQMVERFPALSTCVDAFDLTGESPHSHREGEAFLRIPFLPHRGSVSGMAALYTINRQDVHPIIGPTAIEGFAVANGFSGHGFKESQMVGSMMAQWLTGERADWDTDVPMSFFSVDREPIDVDEKTVLA